MAARLFKDNEFLEVLLGVFGIPDFAFEYADPVVLLYAVIFSEHLFVLVLSVVIWTGRLFFTSYHDRRTFDKMKGGGTSKSDVLTHQYSDINSMSDGFKEKKSSWFWAVFKGFILPVIVIYIAISASLYLVYG